MTEPLLVGALLARGRARDGVEHAFADGRRQLEVVLAEDDQPQRQTDIGREDMGRCLTGVDDQPSLAASAVRARRILLGRDWSSGE